MTLSVKAGPDWMQILRDDIASTGSISKTAERVGIARSSLSAIINNTASSPYATGKASTAKVEERVMNTIGMVACPFLSEYHGSEHRITGLQCREFAYRENPPTGAPREMQHWRSCQGCEKRVPPPTQETVTDKSTLALPEVGAPMTKARRAKPPKDHEQELTASREKIQQAGVIDRVTLALPEVGAPQIGIEASQAAAII